MKLSVLNTGTFRLDGGAIFGVIPKSLWSKEYRADENNLCTLSLRCLLIESEGRLILIDTGVGNKQDEKFFRHYFREGHHSLDLAMEQQGYKLEDVTDVILSHLHFDHAGGAVSFTDNQYKPAMPNAMYHISQKHWNWALNPNQREKASFLKENFMPLFEENKINFIREEGELFPGVEIRLFNGHTDGMIVPVISYKGRKLVYTADFFAFAAQIPLSWVCGYDTRPLISFEEKKLFLEEASKNGYIFFFEHDYYTECCEIIRTEKGFRAGNSFTLASL